MIYKDSLIILAVAGLVVPILHRLKINTVLAFLAAGSILGPHGLGQLTHAWPELEYVTVSKHEGLSLLGDLGIVFLLFLIGMELSLQRLITMRRLVFGLGGLQVIFCSLALMGIAMYFKVPTAAAILIGSALALSSTAIVIQILARQKRLNTATGRASFSILLFQDIAIIPILFLTSVLGIKGESEPQILFSLAAALAQAGIAVAGIIIVGRLIMRPLFRMVASTDSSELFTATTLLLIIAASVTAASAGASMALGAFVAGLLIAETEYSRAIGAIIEPFKGLFLGIFFFTVGMGIDVASVFFDPLPIIGAMAALMIIKAVFIMPLVRVFGFTWPIAFKTALMLAPAGEFVFVIVGLSVLGGIVAPELGTFILTVSSLSMALIPVMATLGNKITNVLPSAAAPYAPAPPFALLQNAQALVIGMGRVGQLACKMLEHHNIPYIAIDRDPYVVNKRRNKSPHVFYGNAQDPVFLAQCGLDTVKTVIISGNTSKETDDIVRAVRSINKNVPIVSRAHDAHHAKRLYALGVTRAVPETIEASLQLAEASLTHLGISEGAIYTSIQKKRDELQEELKTDTDIISPHAPEPA